MNNCLRHKGDMYKKCKKEEMERERERERERKMKKKQYDVEYNDDFEEENDDVKYNDDFEEENDYDVIEEEDDNFKQEKPKNRLKKPPRIANVGHPVGGSRKRRTKKRRGTRRKNNKKKSNRKLRQKLR
jgi:hypothetical protein